MDTPSLYNLSVGQNNISMNTNLILINRSCFTIEACFYTKLSYKHLLRIPGNAIIIIFVFWTKSSDFYIKSSFWSKSEVCQSNVFSIENGSEYRRGNNTDAIINKMVLLLKIMQWLMRHMFDQVVCLFYKSVLLLPKADSDNRRAIALIISMLFDQTIWLWRGTVF